MRRRARKESPGCFGSVTQETLTWSGAGVGERRQGAGSSGPSGEREPLKGFEQRHEGVAMPVSRRGAGHSPRQGVLGKVSSRWGTSIQLAVGLERVHYTWPALWEEKRVGGQLSSLRALQDLLTSPSLV